MGLSNTLKGVERGSPIVVDFTSTQRVQDGKFGTQYYEIPGTHILGGIIAIGRSLDFVEDPDYARRSEQRALENEREAEQWNEESGSIRWINSCFDPLELRHWVYTDMHPELRGVLNARRRLRSSKGFCLLVSGYAINAGSDDPIHEPYQERLRHFPHQYLLSTDYLAQDGIRVLCDSEHGREAIVAHAQQPGHLETSLRENRPPITTHGYDAILGNEPWKNISAELARPDGLWQRARTYFFGLLSNPGTNT